MTRKEHAQAERLVGEIISAIDSNPIPLHQIKRAATRLQKLVAAPPTISEILLQVPAENHTDRAKQIGLSRQGYYNLLNNTARPNIMTAARLAALTGIPAETIRQAW